MFAPFGPTGHYRYRGFVCAGTTDSPTDRQKNLIGHYIRYFGDAARAGTKRSDNGSSPLGICSPSLKVGASPSPSRSLPCFSPCVCVRSVLCLRSIFLRAEGTRGEWWEGKESAPPPPRRAAPLHRSLSEFVLRPGRRSIQFQMVREREPNARRENEVMRTNYRREDLSAYFVSGEKTTPRPREGARRGEAPLTFSPYLCMVRTSWTSQLGKIVDAKWTVK